MTRNKPVLVDDYPGTQSNITSISSRQARRKRDHEGNTKGSEKSGQTSCAHL